jgi:hypothetical protein
LVLAIQDATRADMKMQVKAHLSSEEAGLWLLVIDNADDMSLWGAFNGSSPALKAYLPQSKYDFVLFTTRNQQLATKFVGPEVINIPQMDDKMATDLPRASLIDKNLVNDHQTSTQRVKISRMNGDMQRLKIKWLWHGWFLSTKFRDWIR